MISNVINRKEKVQKIARRILTKHNEKYPVKINEIISKYAEVEYEDYPFDVDAICVNNEDGYKVFIKENSVNANRLRFTLAHELGHMVIPWHIGTISCHIDENIHYEDTSYYEIESDANYFASELLMPSNAIKEICEKEISLEEKIKEAQEQFEVSIPALLLKMQSVLDT
ncbi:MAG: ImmA/IrrE family metallo-endopeptidase, partial [Acidaminobacteraceae bacterium]